MAIVKPDRLGDFILSLGAIRQIVNSVGATNCYLVVSEFSRELAAREFPEVEIVVVRYCLGRLWRTRSILRELGDHALLQSGVDRLICLRRHRFPHDDLICAAIPNFESIGSSTADSIPIGGNRVGRRIEFDQTVACPVPTEGLCEEIGWQAAIASKVLGRSVGSDEIEPRIAVGESPLKEPWISVSPFGSAEIRDLPLALLVAAAKEAVRFGLGVRFLAPLGDASRYEALAARVEVAVAGSVRVEVVTTPSTEALVATLVSSRLVLTTETATAHLAAALDLSMVAVLGGGHFGIFAPWRRSPRQVWIHRRVPCYGCNWVCPLPRPICIHEIDPGQVSSALGRAMGVPEK